MAVPEAPTDIGPTLHHPVLILPSIPFLTFNLKPISIYVACFSLSLQYPF